MSDTGRFPEKLAAAHPVLKEIRIVIGILQDSAYLLRQEPDDLLAERVHWCGNHLGELIDGYIEHST